MSPLEASRVTDLVFAVQQNDEQRVNLLLGLHVEPDHLDVESGWSALHAAVLYAPNLLPAILAHCKGPDSAVVMGGTTLSYVVHELGEDPDAERRALLFDVAEQLLRAGANPWGGASDQAPLALARLYGLVQVEKLLLDQIGRIGT